MTKYLKILTEKIARSKCPRSGSRTKKDFLNVLGAGLELSEVCGFKKMNYHLKIGKSKGNPDAMDIKININNTGK